MLHDALRTNSSKATKKFFLNDKLLKPLIDLGVHGLYFHSGLSGTHLHPSASLRDVNVCQTVPRENITHVPLVNRV